MPFSELFAKLKNAFKNSKLYVSALSCPESNIKLPTRQEFQNDSLVDFYKTEYQSALTNIKHSNALVLEADELNYNITMIIELLEDTFYSELKENISLSERKINYLINCAKLKLYLNDIISYQNEVTAHLIALNEVKKEKFILSRLKKEAINNVLNRLYISLNILITNQISIINQVRSYLNSDLYADNSNLDELITKKINYLTWLQNILSTEERVKLDINSKSIYSDIAKATILLEKYVYIHKDEITPESKQAEIEAILTIPFDEEHKDEILHKIETLEIKYRVFYDYSTTNEYRNIPIDETDLATLYNLKFNALVGNAVIVDTIIILKNIKDEIERDYYESIVIDMYQRIILGQNEIFNKLFKDNFTLAIDIIKEIYKNKLVNILNNNLSLSLLLALNSEDGLNKLLNIKISNYFLPSYLYNSNFIKTEDFIPLKTLCYFESLQDESEKKERFYEDYVPFYDIKENLYKLYLIYRKNNLDKDDEYHLPEGIESIRDQRPLDKMSLLYLHVNMLESATNRTVYFPSTLKKLLGNFLANTTVKGFVLNEGLETLQSAAWLLSCKTINFPSTIKAINITSYAYNYIENIIANISKDNAPILDYESAINKEILKHKLNFSTTYLTWKEYLNSDHCKNIFIHINELDEDIIIDSFMIYQAFLSYNTYFVQPFLISKNEPNYTDYFKSLIYEKLQIYKAFNELLPRERQISISDDSLSMINDCEIIQANLREYLQNNEEEEKQILEKFQKMYSIPYDVPLDILKAIEIKLLAFARYGNNKYINSDTIYNFYVLKFKVITHGDELIDPFISVQSSNEEIASYKKFISETLQGVNHELFKKNIFTDIMHDTLGTFGEDNSKLKEAFIDILKNGEEEIDPYKILTDYYLLNIFLSMFSKNYIPFQRMFKLKVNIENSQLFLDTKIFSFADQLSLHDIMVIYYYSNMDFPDMEPSYPHHRSYFKVRSSFYNFCNLYLKIRTFFQQPYAYLNDFSECIAKINTSFYNNPKTLKKEKAMLDKFRKIVKDAYVFCSYAEVIEGDVPLFESIRKIHIIFKDNTSMIKGQVFANQSFEELSLPSSIRKIDPTAFNFSAIKRLKFKDYNPENYNIYNKILTYFFSKQESKGKTIYTTTLQEIVFEFEGYEHIIDIQKDIELLQGYDLTEEPMKAITPKLDLGSEKLEPSASRSLKKQNE